MQDSLDSLLRQVQSLKKQLQTEKQAHEQTIKQLDSACQLSQSLKSMLKEEQKSAGKAKTELTDALARIESISHHYEVQIEEVKGMLSLKENELSKVSSVLMVNDYDLIRLKVLNEVESTHHQEVQELKGQLSKIEREAGSLERAKQVLEEKNVRMSDEIDRMARDREEKIEEVSSRFIGEINLLYDSVEKGKKERKALEKANETLKNKLEAHEHHFKTEISNLQEQLEKQNRHNSRQNLETKTEGRELREAYRVIEEWKHEVEKRDQIIVTLKKDKHQAKRVQSETAKQLHDAQDLIYQLKSTIPQKEVQHPVKPDRGPEVDALKSKITQLQEENRRLRIPEKKAEKDDLSERRMEVELKAKEVELKAKEVEVRTKEAEIRRLEKIIGQHIGRGASLPKEGDKGLKAKLQEANGKIVELLREKIILKQQVVGK